MFRVIEFFLTDWMHGHRIGYVRVSSFDQNRNARWWRQLCGTLDTRTTAC